MKISFPPRIDLAVLLLAGLVWVSAATGQDLATFEKSMTEFTLDNGLKFLVLERHEAPVAVCLTHANVGAVDEVKGITGVAHLLEHLAFKGTKTIGTRDYEAELKVEAQMDDMFEAIEHERRMPGGGNTQRLMMLYGEFDRLQRQESELLQHDEFEDVLKRAGGVGLNATTTYDDTVYYVKLPANKLELWMLLESDRFRNPVLREFYKEKDVVLEERRQRVEGHALGRLGEELLAAAYKAHPYGEPAVGHRSDLEALTRAKAQAFRERYYGPGNLTIAIIGDVAPPRVKELAQTYFGRIPPRPPPDPVKTVEPTQPGERRVMVEDRAQPIIIVGYHKSSITHPDSVVFDVAAHLLGAGRTSRLYKTLVKDKRIAMQASGFQDRPGNKYPGLFVVYAVPAKNHTNEECEAAIYAEIERLKNEPVTAGELEKARTCVRVGLLRQLDSGFGLARQLTFYEVTTGDWRDLFRRLDRIGQVTPEDLQRVARACFTTKNRTVGLVRTISTME